MNASAVFPVSVYFGISPIVDDVGSWEFETLHGRNIPQPIERSQSTLPPTETQDSDTIRALGSTSALPTSLRHLFEYSSQVEPFYPKPMNLLQPSTSPTTALQDKNLKFSAYQDGLWPGNQLAKDVSASMSDTAYNQSPQAPDELFNSVDATDTLGVTNANYLPTSSIEIPDLDELPTITKPLSISPDKHSDEASNSSPSPEKSPRSRSTTEAPEHRFHDRDLASPAAFRFPLNQRAKNKAQVADAFVPIPKPIERLPSSHQATHSLDTPSRRAVIQPFVPPSMYRARSATAVRQVHNRHGSKPLDLNDESLSEPSKLPIRNLTERSGSEASLGTPGLKDVLKVSQLNP